MAEMSAVMRERDRQADERMKLMADTMQRRDMGANVRMMDLMTTMQDLTLGVKAIVSQTAAAQVQAMPRAPQKYQQVDMPSTSAALQATDRTVAQPTAEQTDQAPKVGTTLDLQARPDETQQDGGGSTR